MLNEKLEKVIEKVREKDRSKEHPLDISSPHTDLRAEIIPAADDVGVELDKEEFKKVKEELR